MPLRPTEYGGNKTSKGTSRKSYLFRTLQVRPLQQHSCTLGNMGGQNWADARGTPAEVLMLLRPITRMSLVAIHVRHC
ncbi:hypothetical protein BRAS3843_140009 [Bradyrhizobium sp. STM 3843]|nr:hypothetical protein BRAS3843_140009 [Bradyrhizobium sp. STM 3843]